MTDDAPPSGETDLAEEIADDIARMRKAQTAPKLFDAASPDEVRERLVEMWELDQYVRARLSRLRSTYEDEAKRAEAMSVLTDAMRAVDEVHTDELKAFVHAEGWPTISEYGEDASQRAWLIAQHADADRAFQREVLERMEPLLAASEVGQDNYAYLWDRVAVADGRPQRYGTQGRIDASGVWQPREVEAPEDLDARRQAVGLPPMSEYRKMFE